MKTEKDFGDAFYARKMYDLAIPEYEKFLASTPVSAERPAALFRLAESYRILGNIPAAKAAYERLLREVRTGEFAAAAAYRLGSMNLDENQPELAAGNFEISRREATDPAIRLSSLFFAARSYELAGQNRTSLKLYEDVLKEETADDRYRDATLAALARINEKLDRIPQAISYYQKLGEVSKNPDLRTESTIKAANLLIQEKKFDQARDFLKRIVENPEAGEWAAAARFALLELDYAAGAFDRIAALKPAEIRAMPAASRVRAELLVAHANRQLGRFAEALRMYDALVASHPESDLAREARFHRLVCLFRMNDPGLMDALNAFLLEAKDPSEIAQARLLKAETEFAAGQYAEAAETYGSLASASLTDELRADAAYKHAWCLAKTGRAQEAVVAYSDFMVRFPKDKRIPQALVARGMAHAEAGALDAAIRDFDHVVQAFLESREREVAMLQRGLVRGSQRDYAQMRRDFEDFIAAFPDSPARAQAEFWIGYAKFENKDYEGCLAHFETARKLDPETYAERANLRLMLANYYLERPEATAEVIEKQGMKNVPAEVYQWLAAKFLEKGNQPQAEKYLRLVLEGAAPGVPKPELYLQLARNQLAQGKPEGAFEPIKKYLEATREPAARAQGLLVLAEAQAGKGDFEAAEKTIAEAQLLQPEGRINAESRLLFASLQERRGNFEEAAKAYMTVALLYDDEDITPRALDAAAKAFDRSSNPSEAARARQELVAKYPNYKP
jgi:tetratricopeptide (TPR) repeat protein